MICPYYFLIETKKYKIWYVHFFLGHIIYVTRYHFSWTYHKLAVWYMSLTRFWVLPLSPWQHNWATTQGIFNKVTIFLHIFTILYNSISGWMIQFFTLLNSGHIISIGQYHSSTLGRCIGQNPVRNNIFDIWYGQNQSSFKLRAH